MTGRPHSVFISYAHEDGSFVNAFAAVLNTYDMNVWKDSKDIPIGGNILKSVYEGIRNASHFCCIISSHSIQSAWVERELSFAGIRQIEDPGLAIVPVLIDPVEIPDYVRIFRCAHLENRDLSIHNPELLMVLKAFGTDLHRHLREIITGPERRNLLKSCGALRAALSEFRARLGGLQDADNAHRAAVANRGYDKPPKQPGGSRRSDSRYRPTTYGSDARIRRAKEEVAWSMNALKGTAAHLAKALAATRQAVKEADPSKTTRVSGLLYLDGVGYMTRETARVAGDGWAWWLGQKLSEWVSALPRDEASVEAAVALLRSWASFDPPGDVATGEELDDGDIGEDGMPDHEEEDEEDRF